jgi:hypothetical protein
MSHRWNWQERVRAFDNWLARQTTERVSRRLAEQSDAYSKIASERLASLTPAEKQELSLQQVALCSKIALELTGLEKQSAMEDAFSSSLTAAIINIRLIPSCPAGYCYVRFGDDAERDTWTWIRIEDAPAYAREHPEHLAVA